MSIEAMKQALEALLDARYLIEHWGGYASEYFQNKHDLKNDIANADRAITSLRQAIAEAEKQEPVMWVMPDGKTVDKWGLQFYGGQTGKPLYAHKREWVGLTDEERADCLKGTDWQYDPEAYAVVIEAKLKERNT